MARPFPEHERRCADMLKKRDFRPDDPRVDDECVCNGRYWRLVEWGEPEIMKRAA